MYIYIHIYMCDVNVYKYIWCFLVCCLAQTGPFKSRRKRRSGHVWRGQANAGNARGERAGSAWRALEAGQGKHEGQSRWASFPLGSFWEPALQMHILASGWLRWTHATARAPGQPPGREVGRSRPRTFSCAKLLSQGNKIPKLAQGWSSTTLAAPEGVPARWGAVLRTPREGHGLFLLFFCFFEFGALFERNPFEQGADNLPNRQSGPQVPQANRRKRPRPLGASLRTPREGHGLFLICLFFV